MTALSAVLVGSLGKRRGEQHSGRAVHKAAGLVEHQHRRQRQYAGDPDRSRRWNYAVIELAGVPKQRPARRCGQFLRHRGADQHDLRRHERQPAAEQRLTGSGCILGCIQRHACRSRLCRQLDVPLTARVLCGRMVVLRVSAQRCRSRRAVCRREGVLWLAVTVIAL